MLAFITKVISLALTVTLVSGRSPRADFIAPVNLSPSFLMTSRALFVPCGESMVMSHVPTTPACGGAAGRACAAARTKAVITKPKPRILFIGVSPSFLKVIVDCRLPIADFGLWIERDNYIRQSCG